MTPSPLADYESLRAFVQARIDEARSLPTLELAAKQILDHVVSQQFQGDHASWGAALPCLFAISGVWRHHPDYEGWAEDQ